MTTRVTVVLAALAGGAALIILYRSRKQEKDLLEQVEALKSEVAKAKQLRWSERESRVRLQQQMRQMKLEAPNSLSLADRAIGRILSCYSRRNGTPRQPALVTGARAELRLKRQIPLDSLDGLEQYSHCWVIYVFHQNTNLHLDDKIKGRVGVPRLDGQQLGIFATRTPHRPARLHPLTLPSPPVPVGLSLGKVVSVDLVRGSVLFEGLDLVDGTPVLDIKPFVPFCDSAPEPRAPFWVTSAVEGPEGAEPLHISSVTLAEGVRDKMWAAFQAAESARRAAWEREHSHLPKGPRRDCPPPLYASADDFEAFARQVLSLDIRAVRHRKDPSKWHMDAYNVVLCCVQLFYKVSEDRAVTVVDAKQALPEDDYLLALQQRRAEELAACGALSELPVEEDGELEPLGEGQGAGAGVLASGRRLPRRGGGQGGRGGPPQGEGGQGEFAGGRGGGGSEAAEAGKRGRKAKKEKAKAARAELEAARNAADAAGGCRTSTGGHSGADDEGGGD